MRRSLFRRTLGASLAIAATATAVFAAAPQGQAAVPNTDVLTVAGSDTTMDVMGAIVAADGTPGKTFNIRAGAFQSTPLTVPGAVADGGDGLCATYTYQGATVGGDGSIASPLNAPDGSGAGRTALHNSLVAGAPYSTSQPGVTNPALNAAPNGCVDIARSSSYSGSFDPGTAEFFAFAVDASVWGSASPNAPATLTQSQLQGIYTCIFTDWSQVGGQPGPIQRVLAQVNSGSGQGFASGVLGVDPTASQLPSGVAGCPDIIRIQENQFTDMYFGTNNNGGGQGSAKQYANAIFSYSVGKWSYQASHADNPTLDLRAGFRPGSLTVDTGTTQSPVNGVAWTGSKWQPNTASVVGTAAVGVRANEVLKTTSGSNVVTLVPTTHTTAATVTTTNGSYAVTAPVGTFTQNDVGGAIANGGVIIPSGTIITGLTTSGGTDTAVISKKPTANSTGSVVLSSHFLATDQGAALSGNATNITNGSTIALVIDATHAQISSNALATDATGTSTAIAPVSQVHEVAGMNTTINTKIVTAAAGTFTNADIGAVIQSKQSGTNVPCTAFGTRIVSIGDSGAGAGSQATLASNSPLTCSGASAKIGFTPASEGAAIAQAGAVGPYPGARFVFNVLEHGSASYADARDLVGYEDSPGGAKSPLCSGHHTTTVDPGGDDIIADNGFVPITPHTSVGGNTGVTCYLIAN